MNELIDEWDDAVEGYRAAEAREISARLAPLLSAAGHVDSSSAFRRDRWLYWARVFGHSTEVSRAPAFNK
jgi:hypothetical protein